jgi:UbiD family decarboxylase
MMIGGRRMTGVVSPAQHLGKIWTQWAELGKPMPYALVQGGDPAIGSLGGIPVPEGVDEAGFIGALYGEPLELVGCELSDLQVPASAEIVIKGHLSVERVAVEGPFGAFAGYVPDKTSLQPVYTVECITHRDDPIWPIVPEGRPVDEYHTVTGPGLAADTLYRLRAAGLPVSTAWAPLHAATHWLVVTVPAHWRDLLPGTGTGELAHRIGEVPRDYRGGHCHFSTVYVLDDDIDPSDDADLLWALPTRIHPTERAEVTTASTVPLMNCYRDAERKARTGPVVVRDGLLPPPGEGRLPQSSFAEAYPSHIRRRVLDHWDD